MRTTGLYINGDVVISSGAQIECRNPATGDVVSTVGDATLAEVDLAVQTARKALDAGWSVASQRDRSDLLRRIAALVRERSADLVAVEVEETGRPVSELSTLDIPETADCFDFYASAIRVLRGETIALPDPYVDYTAFDPIGVVAAFVPWNFPLNLASWKVAPALAMGNAVILKPSELTSGTALMLAEIAKEAGLPDGVLNVVTGFGASAGQALVRHPSVDMVAFTGGGQSGRAIAGQAAAVGKKVALELGGKSAQIVFPDADRGAALASLLEGAFFAQGQNCCAGSRLLVHESVADELIKELVARAGALRVGDPQAEATQVGCLVSERQFERVTSYIESARKSGAEVHGRAVLDGVPQGRPFIAPTVVFNAAYDAAVVQEEVFGPVLVANTFADEEEAVALANGTQYDLAVGVWTSDISRAYRMAKKVRAGSVWINTYNRVFNDTPFGGMGRSGHGRDLGLEAMAQYTHVKNICTAYEPEQGWY